MAGRGWRAQLGAVLYRVYISAYTVVVGFALIGDLNGNQAKALPISPRTSAAAGLGLIAVVMGASLLGRIAVALRPSPAEVQLTLLSPVDRATTLARPIGVTSTAATFAAGGAELVLMLVASPQFGGLSIGVQLAYVAFAAAVGLVTYGGHLLVAERRLPLIGVVGVALLASLYDVVAETSWSPVTAAVRGVREGSPILAVAAPLALGVLLVWRGSVGAEAIEFEKISRGGDIADQAATAMYGNDLRTLLVLQRSMSVQPFRHRPIVRVASRLARRLPVLMRTARGVARWRVYRWLFIVAVSTAIGGLLRVQPASARTVGLAALSLWLLGLAMCESLAEEHDRSDRLALLPMARSIEYRQLGSCWLLVLCWLAVVCTMALSGRAGIATSLPLAVTCASGATAAAAISFRRTWRPLAPSPGSMVSPVPGAELAMRVIWPAVVVALCIGGWGLQARGLALLAPSVFVFACLAFWIRTGGVMAVLHRAFPKIVPAPQ